MTVPPAARAVAERDKYRHALRRLLARLRAKGELCGYCGRPLIEPGECGLPGVHVDADRAVE